jgi:hypothetical protein
MVVICFLCTSLGSSTVQLHDSLGSRRACACSETGFSSQNGDRDWEVYYRRAAVFYEFLWAKGLSAKDIHKEMFPVCGGKWLSCKAGWQLGQEIATLVAHVSLMTKRWKRRRGSGRDNSQKTSVVRVSTHGTSVSVLVEDMSRNTCFLQTRISHVLLRFICICDLFTDSLSYVGYWTTVVFQLHRFYSTEWWDYGD